MFDFGLGELLLILLVALLVMGPDDFPRVARGLAQVVRKLGQFVSDAKKYIDEAGKK